MPETSFCTLLCRYFFFGWLFRDVREGDMFERAANLRFNREQARWLPVYLRRWLGWGVFFCALAVAAEGLLPGSRLSSLLYAVGGLSISFNIAIAAVWIGLRQGHGPA
jgi:hypothetical protein